MTKHCSVFALCVAAISTLVSVAFVGIAFSTDNWLHVSVNRQQIKEYADWSNNTEVQRSLIMDIRYFDRIRGIFRVCFPRGEKPQPTAAVASNNDKILRILENDKTSNEIDSLPLVKRNRSPRLYLNPVDEWCTNIDYYMQLLTKGLLPEKLTRDGEIWFHFARTTVATFCLFFMFSAIACVTGLMGCWKASGDHLISTAALMLMASLCGAAGMGFWHGAQFYEFEKVYDERLEFYMTWPDVLRRTTSFSIGWSYIVSWIGIGVAFVASMAFSIAAISTRSELRDLERKAERLLSYHNSATNTVSRHPQLYHPQFMHPYHHHHLSGSQLSLNQIPAHEMPPMPMHHPHSVSGTYYSVGYPVHHPYNPAADSEIISSNDEIRTIKYKNVVKELEDAKL